MADEQATNLSSLHKKWHLAENEEEFIFSNLEFAVMRISAALDRWEKDCLACCVEGGMSGMDSAVLHMIRMHDRPKSISDIVRTMNRDDISNLQYSLRKLTSRGLIERAGKKDSKRSATYQVTAEGERVTDLYAKVRRELLIPLLHTIKDFEGEMGTACRILNVVSGIYDNASSIAATQPRE